MAHIASPPYFSWIVDKLLAISAHPFHHTHLNYYKEKGINTIVSINDEIEPPFHVTTDMKVIRFPLGKYACPTLADCQYFVSLMENAKRRHETVVVHSVKGTGRAAVLVACYLVKAWECPADYVINHLRIVRPLSIENSEQEMVINQFRDSVFNNFERAYRYQAIKFNTGTDALGVELETQVAQPIADDYQLRNPDFV